jgi:2'-5' RNA ligase
MKHRIFIAINLPQNIKQELVDLISDLQKINSSPSIKWVKPEGLHITLHFLGYLDVKQIETVKKIIIGVALTLRQTQDRLFKSDRLRFTEINGFPNLSRPRVIFMAVEEINNETLQQVQKVAGQNLEKAGFQIDHRPWRPHITLARVKIPGIKLRVIDYQLSVTTFQVKTIDLMESQLQRDGPKYRILKRFPLYHHETE